MKYEQPKPEHVVDRRSPSNERTFKKEYFRLLLEKFHQDRWNRCCRAMQIHVMRRDRQAAIATLEAYMREGEPRKASHSSLLIHILPDRIANLLADCGVHTVADARDWLKRNPESVSMVGGATVAIVKEMVQAVRLGVALELRADDLDDPAIVAASETGGG